MQWALQGQLNLMKGKLQSPPLSLSLIAYLMLVQYGRPLGAHYLADQATVISGAEQLDDAGRWPWYQQQQEE